MEMAALQLLALMLLACGRVTRRRKVLQRAVSLRRQSKICAPKNPAVIAVKQAISKAPSSQLRLLNGLGGPDAKIGA